jgi:hypothetical protein
MFSILFFLLLNYIISFKIISKYSDFHNFTEESEKNATINVQYDNNENQTNCKIFYYKDNINEYEQNECKKNEDDSFNCSINENGDFSLITKGNNGIITLYRNYITIYEKINENNITYSYSNILIEDKCFFFDEEISNKNLFSLNFSYYIKKNLFDFYLCPNGNDCEDDNENQENKTENNKEKIKVIPYYINNISTTFGVENQIFKNIDYDLIIKPKNGSAIKIPYVLNLSSFKNVNDDDSSDDTKIYEILWGENIYHEFPTNVYDYIYVLFNKDMYDLKTRLTNFSITFPQASISPTCDEEKENNNKEKGLLPVRYLYNETYYYCALYLNVGNFPGQAYLYYNYCGKEFNYSNITFYKTFGRSVYLSNKWLFINKIFLIVITIIFMI